MNQGVAIESIDLPDLYKWVSKVCTFVLEIFTSINMCCKEHVCVFRYLRRVN